MDEIDIALKYLALLTVLRGLGNCSAEEEKEIAARITKTADFIESQFIIEEVK